jgi:plastocyanin
MLAALVPLLLLSASLPVPCTGTCVVQGSGVTGFTPPLLVMQSGSAVAWEASDGIGHFNVEGAFGTGAGTCFSAPYAGVQRSDAIRLTIEGSVLVAEQNGVSLPCVTATMLPGGNALLSYQCFVHPLTMKGLILVVA